MGRIVNGLCALSVAVCACFSCLSCGDPLPAPPSDAVELILLNWEEYYDQSVLDEFKERTGIAVRIEEYGQAPECIARLQNDPGAFDLIITDGPTIDLLVRADLLERLDMTLLPNARHLDEEFRSVHFDPGNDYAIPYLYGTTGLAINTKYTPRPIRRWRDLLDPALKGKIALFDDSYEAMAALLLAAGHPLNSTDPQHLAGAAEVAQQLHKQEVLLSDYYPLQDKLIAGEVWVTMAYSGDLLKAAQEHSEIEYVVPEEGGNKWIDSYAMPRYTEKVDEVHAFLDFVMEPEVAARISNSQHYATPNKAAVAMLEPEILENPIIYPPGDVLERCEFLVDVGEAGDEYARIFGILTKGSRE
ncbi:MAG: spermidine/putrescine ABC transporter substrate-binding protein [bacterium]|nr:spermidine/putrescine ABC transporter substrate-binding protein [bacterium]